MGMSLADDARIAELERRVADLEMRLAAHLDGEVEPDTQDPTRMTGVVRRKAR
jgi:hypothetical protein